MTIGELKKQLEGYPDDTPCAHALWLPDDVRGVVVERLNRATGGDYELDSLPEGIITDEEVADVLHEVDHRHDCNYGISWDTIHCTIPDEVDERIESYGK